jgi:hypothetical protein
VYLRAVALPSPVHFPIFHSSRQGILYTETLVVINTRQRWLEGNTTVGRNRKPRAPNFSSSMGVLFVTSVQSLRCVTVAHKNIHSVLGVWGGQSRVRIPVGARYFSVPQNVQTGSGAHQASYSMGTGIKRPGREVNHSPSYSAEVTTECSYISASAIRLNGMSRENIVFYLWICT